MEGLTIHIFCFIPLGLGNLAKYEHSKLDKQLRPSLTQWRIQGKGPRPSPTSYFYTKLRPEEPKKILFETTPRPLIWRSGSPTVTAWQTGKVRWVNSSRLIFSVLCSWSHLVWISCRLVCWGGSQVTVDILLLYLRFSLSLLQFQPISVSFVCCPMSLFQGHVACRN